MVRKIALILGTVSIAWLGIGSIAQADEILKFRSIMHTSNVQTLDIGDVEGHILGVTRYSGIVSFADNSVGTTYFTAAIEYTKGAGPVTFFDNVAYEDGSVLWLKCSGAAAVNGAKTNFSGTLQVIGGSGKFAGAKGDGSFSGARTTPLASGADLYLDFVVSVKK